MTKSRPTWERLPSKSVFYYRSPNQGNSYVMSFLYTFEGKSSEETFFAYCFPYTYTDLQRYLYRLERKRLPFFTRTLLTRTVQFRRLDLLTITAPDTSGAVLNPKRIVVSRPAAAAAAVAAAAARAAAAAACCCCCCCLLLLLLLLLLLPLLLRQ